MDITTVMTYKDKTIPAGWYTARILEGENVISGKTGITGYKCKMEVIDTTNKNIDLKKFNDPIGARLYTTVWHPDEAKQGSLDKAESCARALSKFIKSFDIDPSDKDEDGFLRASNFSGLTGMVQVKLVAEDPAEYKELKAAGLEASYEGMFTAEVAFGGFKKQ